LTTPRPHEQTNNTISSAPRASIDGCLKFHIGDYPELANDLVPGGNAGGAALVISDALAVGIADRHCGGFPEGIIAIPIAAASCVQPGQDRPDRNAGAGAGSGRLLSNPIQRGKCQESGSVDILAHREQKANDIHQCNRPIAGALGEFGNQIEKPEVAFVLRRRLKTLA
ncbi:MAG: hypothetical protein K2X00_21130, partial [Nitrospiraceae bacterium]|nr:hypothetical protein [Nitrospiraceae bacterium]